MKKYRKDYIADSHITDKGKVIKGTKYIGDYYAYRLSVEEYKKMRLLILLSMISITVIFASLGFLNNSGSYCFYVLIPYISIFLPITYLVRGYLRIPRELQKMEYAIYDKSYIRVKYSLVGMIAVSTLTVLGDFIFIIRNAENIFLAKEAGFCAANLLIDIISIGLLIYHNRIVCEKLSA